MKLKKLPIGISTLKDILNEDYIYVDKTKIAQEIIENGRYYFLSRPRRFGKSLFLDTLKSILNGEKELFKDLYIGQNGYEFKKYPIIHISFGSGAGKSKADYEQKIYEIMRSNQEDLKIVCDKTLSSSGCFKELIKQAYLKHNQKVVILVDEYDKPILDNIDEPEIAKLMREELKNFYSVIKESDEYIKFVFITGVSKFSRVSLFSGLNNLDDITLDSKYATICGYTQNDVETVFSEHLKGQDFEKIRLWYNGYKFLGEGVYNPFDILLFISKNFEYESYWFSTATPTFLLKLIEKNNYFLPDLENILKDRRMLESFDVDYIELETLMWQTGYLTITNTKPTPMGLFYTLNIPNQEVRLALLGSIADFMSKINNSGILRNDLYEFLAQGNILMFEKTFKSLFASIPYNLFTNNKMYEYEGYYVSVFYAYIKALGLDLVGEDVTNKGRIDLTIKLPNAIYIIEFKVIAKNEEMKQSTINSALAQIKEKNYHEKYLAEKKDMYLIGIEFDTTKRNITKIEWESID